MEFKLPDIGEGVHEGEITRWLVKPGDHLNADQPMVEVMTDKATVELPSPVAGTVDELLASEGQTVEVGKPIIRISENGKGAAAAKAEQAVENKPKAAAAPKVETDQPKTQSPKKQSPRSESEHDDIIPFHILATPATRKLARDLGVDLKSVKGTGSQGRVTKEDVQLAYEGREAAEPRTSHPTPTTALTPSKGSATRVSYVPHGEVQTIPLRGVRKKIAEAMSRSKRTAAHFTYVEEVNMSEIVKLREASKPEAERRGVKLTFLPFIIKGLIPALREFPYLNASLDDEKQEIYLKGDYNIGIATDTENGLMVPNIKDADRKNIWEIATEIDALAAKARTGKIGVEDLKGGTFTVTNAGSIGGVFATPVINHPEVAILGVNAIRKRPIVTENDEIKVGHMMFLSLSVDHRVVDGADAARFMNRLIYFLSDPSRFVFA